MGMFEKLFGKRPAAEQVKGYFKTLTAYQPTFYSYSGGLYEMDSTRAAVHAIATHCSKLKPHITGTNNKALERALQLRPNPWQTTSQFLYRIATILEVENTAFLVPVRDAAGAIVGAFPILPSKCELSEGYDGQMWLRFEFRNGQRAAVEFESCGILTKMQYDDDIYGSSNRALKPTLDLISVQNQGIEQGIKQSAAIRFMAKLGSSIRPDDLKKEQENFRSLNFGADNNGGVMMFDSKYAEVKQIDSKPYIVDAEQMKLINDNVYNYFGVNERILRNEWDEASWNAFYEGKIEPFALQLSEALTSMFFTERERAFGNEIQLSANRLQFATIGNKVSVITQLFDRGMLSRNEAREILQMNSVEDGDDFMIRGEYVGVKDRIEEGKNE